MSEKLITLVTYTYATESYILIAKLDGEGIFSFVKNEHTVSTQNFLSNAVGGIDVQIKEKDLARASEILAEVAEQTKLANAVPASLGAGYEKVLIYCPECESDQVYCKKGSFFSFGSKEHICGDCDHHWKQ
jgi:hypothetical protein